MITQIKKYASAHLKKSSFKLQTYAGPKYDGYIAPKPYVEKHLMDGLLDTRRWGYYYPNDGDIVIATPPKAGTTWTQYIVGQILSKGQSGPKDTYDNSPWIALKVGTMQDFQTQMEKYNEITDKKCMKSHEPVGSLPIYDNLKYIFVGRDFRDIVWSFHNHYKKISDVVAHKLIWGVPYDYEYKIPPMFGELEQMNGGQYTEKDMWNDMLSKPDAFGHDDGYIWWSILQQIGSWWNIRDLPNVKLIHFQNLKDDLRKEIYEIANFIDEPILMDNNTLDLITEKCTFERMKSDRAVPEFIEHLFKEGSESFLNKGESNRWQNVLTEEDIQNYRDVASRYMSDDAIHWMETGQYK